MLVGENSFCDVKSEVTMNGGEPKYDIRDWTPNHEKMGKGTTLTKEELNLL